MKFLFDQSADFRLIAHLRELGHDVSAISRDHPHGLADEDVLAIAQATAPELAAGRLEQQSSSVGRQVEAWQSRHAARENGPDQDDAAI
jgi:hypothetical protein